MIVRVDAENETAELQEPDVFTRLKVLVGGGEAADATRVLGAEGWPDPSSNDRVFIRVDALRRLVGPRAHEPHWSEGFDAMLAYAGTHGWMSDDGAAVRLHCERE